jgi:uncharacterized membrane protein YoaK (UPF0700 family)
MSHTRIRDLLLVSLTLVTGMTDAIGFTRLGGVFTSVMTGNMVLLGIAGAKEDGAIAIHTAIAFAGYIAGSIGGAHIAGAHNGDKSLWPRSFSLALFAEFLLFAISMILWEASGVSRSADFDLALLGINATALGVQSAAVLRLGVSGLSTTYLTGTLTTVVAHLTSVRSFKGLERPAAILAALIVGAAIGAACALHQPVAAPLVQLGLLGATIGIGAWAFKSNEHVPIPPVQAAEA